MECTTAPTARSPPIQSDPEAFEQSAAKLLGPGRVQTRASRVALGGFRRDGVGRLVPRTQDEVVQLITLAGQFGVALHPVGTGRNWGLGSDLPWRDNVYTLDLSSLTRIIELNDDLGYAVVEPGVTQRQLADRLLACGSRFFVDVTGSGADTSLVGASLERGIAYNTLRSDVTGPFKLVLADGRIVETGFPSSVAAKLRHLYPEGIGPDLNGLFYQSNFGIVLEMTIRLVPRGDCLESFVIHVSNKNLPAFLTNFRYLREQNVFRGVTHIANRRRSLASLTPRVVARLERARGRPPDKSEPLKLMNRFFPSDWVAFGTLQGHPEIVKAQKRVFKRYFSRIGKVRFPSQRLLHSGERIAKFLRIHSLAAVIGGTQEFAGLTIGQPTDAALGSTRVLNEDFSVPPEIDPDQRIGFLFALPLVPFEAASIERFLAILNPRIDVAEITLNVLGPQILEGVISINFDQTNPTATDKAHQAIADLHRECDEQGFVPYRVNIDRNFSQFPASTAITRELKSVFDPGNIISPGKYDLSH